MAVAMITNTSTTLVHQKIKDETQRGEPWKPLQPTLSQRLCSRFRFPKPQQTQLCILFFQDICDFHSQRGVGVFFVETTLKLTGATSPKQS